MKKLVIRGKTPLKKLILQDAKLVDGIGANRVVSLIRSNIRFARDTHTRWSGLFLPWDIVISKENMKGREERNEQIYRKVICIA